jgi:hypothetical protein
LYPGLEPMTFMVTRQQLYRSIPHDSLLQHRSGKCFNNYYIGQVTRIT